MASTAQETHEVRLSEHPRALRQIECARAWGGIGAFLLAGWLSHRAGVPEFDVAVRALVAGVAGWFAFWALAVTAWTHLAVAEFDAARTAAKERQAASPAEAQARAAD